MTISAFSGVVVFIVIFVVVVVIIIDYLSCRKSSTADEKLQNFKGYT
jgi:hypothetical protein